MSDDTPAPPDWHGAQMDLSSAMRYGDYLGLALSIWFMCASRATRSRIIQRATHLRGTVQHTRPCAAE